jgi:hypothetical protein
MNQRIPVWDAEGWLIFDNEDDLEPRKVSTGDRANDNQDKPMEPRGLGQRYHERAVTYWWVDDELKCKSQDRGKSKHCWSLILQHANNTLAAVK